MDRVLERISRVASVITILGAVGLTSAGTTATVAAQANQRTITVTILDQKDRPVPDVSPDDLVVREDGLAREVVRVVPAPPPSHIALLVDDSQVTLPAIRELRESLTTFADLMADQTPAPAIRLTTLADRPTVRVDFTATFSGVSRAIDVVMPRPGSGALLLEAILETCRDLRTRRIEGADIVAFVAENGQEFSERTHDDVANALRLARASLWVVVLSGPGGGGNLSSSQRERDIVIGDVTTESGGRRKTVLTTTGIGPAFEELGEMLLSRHAVTYGRPSSLIPPSRLEIEPRNRDWKVQVTRWPAQ